MTREILDKAAQIVSAATMHGRPDDNVPYCVLGLLDPDGSPTASVITPAKADGLERIYFCTGRPTMKVKRIEANPRASVCFASDDHGLSLTGAIEVSLDPELKRKAWYDELRDHFSGPEDPQYCLLVFKPERYSLFIDWQELRGEF